MAKNIPNSYRYKKWLFKKKSILNAKCYTSLPCITYIGAEPYTLKRFLFCFVFVVVVLTAVDLFLDIIVHTFVVYVIKKS